LTDFVRTSAAAPIAANATADLSSVPNPTLSLCADFDAPANDLLQLRRVADDLDCDFPVRH
jgi:hypothetical protein